MLEGARDTFSGEIYSFNHIHFVFTDTLTCIFNRNKWERSMSETVLGWTMVYITKGINNERSITVLRVVGETLLCVFRAYTHVDSVVMTNTHLWSSSRRRLVSLDLAHLANPCVTMFQARGLDDQSNMFDPRAQLLVSMEGTIYSLTHCYEENMIRVSYLLD